MLGSYNANAADLTGPLNMRCTACAHIVTGILNDPNLPRELLLAAIIKRLQFFLGREEDMRFEILIDGPVNRILDHLEI